MRRPTAEMRQGGASLLYCIEGITIMLACVIFSAYVGSPDLPATDSAWQLITSYVVDLLFNLLILVTTVRMSERITREMLGL